MTDPARQRGRPWRRRRSGAAPPTVGLPAGVSDVAAVDEVPTGPPFLPATVEGTAILLGRIDGRLVAFDAACPHLGQPLRRARIEPDGTLECRHHAHAYDLGDGRCVRPGSVLDPPLPLHETGEVDGRVWVRLRHPEGDA